MPASSGTANTWYLVPCAHWASSSRPATIGEVIARRLGLRDHGGNAAATTTDHQPGATGTPRHRAADVRPGRSGRDQFASRQGHVSNAMWSSSMRAFHPGPGGTKFDCNVDMDAATYTARYTYRHNAFRCHHIRHRKLRRVMVMDGIRCGVQASCTRRGIDFHDLRVLLR